MTSSSAFNRAASSADRLRSFARSACVLRISLRTRRQGKSAQRRLKKAENNREPGHEKSSQTYLKFPRRSAAARLEVAYHQLKVLIDRNQGLGTKRAA
jgi:hypothetical protein